MIREDAKFFKEITREHMNIHKDIKHDMIQYVDDSTNNIGGNNVDDMVNYSEDFMKLLIDFGQQMAIINSILWSSCFCFFYSKIVSIRLKIMIHMKLINFVQDFFSYIQYLWYFFHTAWSINKIYLTKKGECG